VKDEVFSFSRDRPEFSTMLLLLKIRPGCYRWSNGAFAAVFRLKDDAEDDAGADEWINARCSVDALAVDDDDWSMVDWLGRKGAKWDSSR